MIRLRGVSKRYGAFQALHPLDLHVGAGEVFGFLGPNGAGKTTTIRMLSGVLTPTTGSIEIDGVDLVADPVESRRRIGYIPDRPYLYDKLTAREFLRFVGGIYGLAIGGLFAGESMFSHASDASKVALVALVDTLREQGFSLLDVQWTTDHLCSLGAVDIPRQQYLELLAGAVQ
jgi:ABC-type sulfate/molybdate transport systems ATPase subunit